LCHQEAEVVERLLALWRRIASTDSILIAHGGARADFDALECRNKIFLEDPRLRARDKQRERQSYHGIWQATSHWLASSLNNLEFIHVVEYDHFPLVDDLNNRQIELLNNENADVLAYHLQRIDGTSHPHYLYHRRDPRFHNFFREISVRGNPEVVLSMFGTGSFWKRDAFEAVATVEEPFPVYLEVYLPTLAHHLGFRLRNYGEQNRFVSNIGDRSREIESARSDGAWTLHPVKNLPQGLLSSRKV
jgi:hypothetical protein